MNPHRRARQQGPREAGQADGRQRELCLRQPHRVQRDARPDGDELRHRAHDGQADPARQEQVDVRERGPAGGDVEYLRDGDAPAGHEEAQRYREVRERDGHRRLAVCIDGCGYRAHGRR
ncbi:hypothetical protein VB773_00850 [Haloarculaceae archaeon H-GB2-1]|nr:hypothetical protein [Haloarculaceae archaeon H-GB2-1]